MQYLGRFAPTPSGHLHFGSLVTALASYLDAKAHGGRWLLRIEDVDTARSRPYFIEQIQRVLEAHHLFWDGEIRWQSAYLNDYEEALLRLKNHLYYCDCSRQKWQSSAKMGELGAIYPQFCLNLHKNEGALRLALPHEQITFFDRLLGEKTYNLTDLGDPILKRRDGDVAYALAVVWDDYVQGITHIVRGQDLLSATPLQIYLQQLLNLPPVDYLHLPLVLNEKGEKLSKSQNAPNLNPETIIFNLKSALKFLNQPIPESNHIDEILKEALFNWNIQNILVKH